MIRTYPPDLKSAARNGHATRPAVPDELPPHSIEAERGALGCVFCTTNVHEMDELLLRMKPRHFYDLRHRTICEEMHKMRMAHHAIDLVLLAEWLTDHKLIEAVGGIGYVAELPDATPSLHNFDAYLLILGDKLARRQMLQLALEMKERAGQTEINIDRVRERVTELMESTGKATGSLKLINIITPQEARAFAPDPASFLVGEGLIAREQFITIGGEPGCGKSRLATTLAVAGARGSGKWQGYPVRSKWRTLILQSENKGTRLKEEFEAVPTAADEHIKVSNSLPEGLNFGSPDFRRELTRIHEGWPFEMLILDPWNDIATDESLSDFAEALRSVERCFEGRTMPAIVIVAHLRKTRNDSSGRRKTGRELLNELSGSLKLGSKSRTVFVVQPASPMMDEDRLVFEVAKANDAKPEWLKEFGTRTAWHRRNGAFEACPGFDWQRWDKPSRHEQERAVTREDCAELFKLRKRAGMKRGEFVTAYSEQFDVGESTVWRSIKQSADGEAGYAMEWLCEAAGIVGMRKGEE